MRLLRSLYVQVLIAVAIGVALGLWRPDVGAQMKPFGDGFIKLVKMMIGPVIFCTVTTGIGRMRDLRRVGRIGVKALIYFEVVTTLALVIGLGVGELVRPGQHVHANVSTLDPKAIETYAQQGHHLSVGDFLLGVIPDTLVDAFARGEILQVLLVSILFGVAMSRLRGAGERILDAIEHVMAVLFGMIEIIMKVAPLGAFGAMAFAVGKYGLETLRGLGTLMLCFYATSLLFIALVLGPILRLCGLRIIPLVRFIRDELLIVLGTSSSESVLPRMLDKLESLGCAKAVVGVTIPMGYSFNLDGTSIYLTLATVFLAQATGVEVSLGEELALLVVLLISSKGAAAVTGGGFITLAATLSTTGHIPVAGLALLLGVDRFMSEARALTNLVGNAVATVVVARLEGELDVERARAALGIGAAVAPPG